MGITLDSGPALRLLYAYLSPLDASYEFGPGTYGEFLRRCPEMLRRRLKCEDVLQFLRRALAVPESVPLFVLAFVDDGHDAIDAFPPAANTPPKVSLFCCPFKACVCMEFGLSIIPCHCAFGHAYPFP